MIEVAIEIKLDFKNLVKHVLHFNKSKYLISSDINKILSIHMYWNYCSDAEQENIHEY